jgi:hypothetical protein
MCAEIRWNNLDMRRSKELSSASLSGMAGSAQGLERHAINLSLRCRLSKGDLPKLSFGVEQPRALRSSRAANRCYEDV